MRNELFNLTLLAAPLPASTDCRTCKLRVLVWMGQGPPGAAWHGAGAHWGERTSRCRASEQQMSPDVPAWCSLSVLKCGVEAGCARAGSICCCEGESQR